MSRRRDIVRGVVVREDSDCKPAELTINRIGIEVKNITYKGVEYVPQGANFDTPEVGEKKVNPLACQYCGRDNFKMAAHKAKHEKSCKQKE